MNKVYVRKYLHWRNSIGRKSKQINTKVILKIAKEPTTEQRRKLANQNGFSLATFYRRLHQMNNVVDTQ